MSEDVKLTPKQQRAVKDVRSELRDAMDGLAYTSARLERAGLSGWSGEARDLEEAVQGLRDGLEKLL